MEKRFYRLRIISENCEKFPLQDYPLYVTNIDSLFLAITCLSSNPFNDLSHLAVQPPLWRVQVQGSVSLSPYETENTVNGSLCHSTSEGVQYFKQ